MRRGRRLFTRGGPLQPALLVQLLLFQVRYGSTRGYARMLEAFWGEAQSLGLELPCEQPVSAQAFCEARSKLPPQIVRSLLHQAADDFDTQYGPSFRWHGRRLLAVDGQRRSLQPCDALRRRFGVPEGSHYPMAHVTTLFDVISKVPLDTAVGPYGADERKQLFLVLDRAREGDVLVLDRGYPAFDVLAMLTVRKLDFIVRVPASNTFKAVEEFLATGRKDGVIELVPPSDCAMRDMEPLRMRIVVVRRDEEPWVLLTSLPPEQFPAEAIEDGYRRRWRVETLHAEFVSKHFDQGFFHAKWTGGVEQEVYAQALFIAITRHLMAAAARDAERPYEQISAKAAVLGVGDHLTRLMLGQPPEKAHAHLALLLRRIAAARYKPRPGRSYPRRSFLPGRKWGPAGRRSGA